MRSIARLANAALVAAALVAGCSSSNSNSDGSMTGPSGFGPTTKLVDLTVPQLMQVCKQQEANGTGLVSCGADASMFITPIGVCTSIQASDCAATVATSQTCANALNAAGCDPQATAAAMKTPECLVMLECTNALCNETMCFCANHDDLSRCEGSCQMFTRGLSTSCASCISGLFGANTCPNFAMQGDGGVSASCASTCAQTNPGG
jgi:hypothetical protein